MKIPCPGLLCLQHKLLKIRLLFHPRGQKFKKTDNKTNHLPVPVLPPPSFSSACDRQLGLRRPGAEVSVCVCICVHAGVCERARLSVQFLLPCQNISCCLFIYFSLITEGIAFPEECQQMIRAQDWYCQQTHASPFCRKNFIFSRRKPWVWSRIQIRFLGIFCYRSAAHQVGQWRELTQLQLSALIQFTASLGEIITALKPVSTVQRGSRTKAPILSFKYSPRVSGMLWRGRGALQLSCCEGRSVYIQPLLGTRVPPSHAHTSFPKAHREWQCEIFTPQFFRQWENSTSGGLRDRHI